MLQKVLVDTCTYSNFALTGSFGLIQELYKNQLCITELILKEINRGSIKRPGLGIILPSVSSKKIEVLGTLEGQIPSIILSLPSKFSESDKYSLAVCKEKDLLLLTDDIPMRKYAKDNLVSCSGTMDILRLAVERELILTDEAMLLLERMDAQANFKTTEKLLAQIPL